MNSSTNFVETLMFNDTARLLTGRCQIGYNGYPCTLYDVFFPYQVVGLLCAIFQTILTTGTFIYLRKTRKTQKSRKQESFLSTISVSDVLLIILIIFSIIRLITFSVSLSGGEGAYSLAGLSFLYSIGISLVLVMFTLLLRVWFIINENVRKGYLDERVERKYNILFAVACVVIFLGVFLTEFFSKCDCIDPDAMALNGTITSVFQALCILIIAGGFFYSIFSFFLTLRGSQQSVIRQQGIKVGVLCILCVTLGLSVVVILVVMTFGTGRHVGYYMVFRLIELILTTLFLNTLWRSYKVKSNSRRKIHER